MGIASAVRNIYCAYGIRGLARAMGNKLNGRAVLYGVSLPSRGSLRNSVTVDSWRGDPLAEDCIAALGRKYLTARKIRYHGSCDAPQEATGRKVLIISHELSGTGAPIVAFEAARVLKEAGCRVLVMAPLYSDRAKMELKESIAEAGIPVICDRHLADYRWCPEEMVPDSVSGALDRIIGCFDLLICNSFCTHNVVRSCSGKKIPVLWWLHEGPESYRKGNADFFPKNLKGNVRVLCGGEYARKTLADFGIGCRSASLLYGVRDLAGDYPEIPGRDRISFILPGTIGKRKNQQLLLKAVRLLPQDLADRAEFVIMGGYDDSEEYLKVKRMAEKLSNVSLLKPVPYDGLMQLYRRMDSVVLPSIDDPMPVVLTEGLMLSKLVICSDHTGTASLIRHGESGFVFESGSEQQLADILRLVIEEGNSERMKSIRLQGRRVFEENFTREAFRRNLLRLIDA